MNDPTDADFAAAVDVILRGGSDNERVERVACLLAEARAQAEPPATGRYVVRIKARSSQWTTPAMPEQEARERKAELRREIPHLGDAFIEFRATGGREPAIRARDVVSIEVAPWQPAQPSQRTGPASPGEWAEWLRLNAAHDQVHEALAGGGS